MVVDLIKMSASIFIRITLDIWVGKTIKYKDGNYESLNEDKSGKYVPILAWENALQ